MPAGLAGIDDGELQGALHPALDPRVNGLGDEDDEGAGGDKQNQTDRKGPPANSRSLGGGGGQYREPFEYGALLRALGLDLDDHEVSVRYYRERAAPHLTR